MNIVLIGFKSAGKTSVGQDLAERMQQSFVDTDNLIEQQYYCHTQQISSVREIFQYHGNDYFRTLEKNVITALPKGHHVIATGGGCILDRANITALKQHGTLIYLSARFDILFQRLCHQPLPTFLRTPDFKADLYEMYLHRQPLYQAAADHIITVDDNPIPVISAAILATMGVTSDGQ